MSEERDNGEYDVGNSREQVGPERVFPPCPPWCESEAHRDERSLQPCWVCGEQPTTGLAGRLPTCDDHLHQSAGQHPPKLWTEATHE